MVRESASNIFNEGVHLLALPNGADSFEYIIGDQGGETFDLEEEVRALGVELSYTEGDCRGGPDTAFQEEGAFIIGEVIYQEGGGCFFCPLALSGG